MEKFKIKKMDIEEARAMGIEQWDLWQDDDLSPQYWLLKRRRLFIF